MAEHPVNASNAAISGGLVSIASARRSWFVCPTCAQRCTHLYLPAVQCRRCCGPDYQCRHVAQGSAAHVAIRLRRQIPGADPWLFAVRRAAEVQAAPRSAPAPGRSVKAQVPQWIAQNKIKLTAHSA